MSRFDSEGSSENRLYLDCFCVVAEGIGVSKNCVVLRASPQSLLMVGCYDESSHITTVF